jgi:hypothetical protein
MNFEDKCKKIYKKSHIVTLLLITLIISLFCLVFILPFIYNIYILLYNKIYLKYELQGWIQLFIGFTVPNIFKYINREIKEITYKYYFNKKILNYLTKDVEIKNISTSFVVKNPQHPSENHFKYTFNQWDLELEDIGSSGVLFIPKTIPAINVTKFYISKKLKEGAVIRKLSQTQFIFSEE